jgi:PBP1b-binding outer membrane lipoprotein LpoB
MTRHGSRAALALSLLAIFVGGCATSEHRMDNAANRDDSRRAQFEHCRDQGRTDCDAILNAPVSSTMRSDSVREQERRTAYNRCVDRGGSDCDDLLHHD